jgi:hypothetical protein
MKTNYKTAPVLVSNGNVSLQESLNQYPQLTITEYAEAGITRKIGDILTYAGLTFILESISIEKCPIPVDNLVDKLTYGYIHVTKKVLEYPIRLADFLVGNKGNQSRKSPDSYLFSIGALVSYAQSKRGYASVSAPSFLVEVSKNPGPEEIVTVKSFIDEKIEVFKLVYTFNGDNVSFTSLGSSAVFNPNIVKNYTIGYGEIPAYKNSPLTWNKQKNENEAQTLDVKRYKQIADAPYLIYEGDHNPHLPPPESSDNTKTPRDLSIMFDNSGITKTCKITKMEWGEPSVELEATFGYAHAAIELVADANKPNVQSDTVIRLMSEDVISSGNAYQEVLGSIKSGKYGYPDDANFANPIVWRLISIKEKEYVYTPLNLSINPKIKKADGTFESVQIAQGLEGYTSTNSQVLTKERTTGWELRRFATEDAQNWTEGSIQSWLGLKTLIALKDTLTTSSILAKQQYYWMLYYAKVNLEKYLYRKIPIWEQIDYSIEAYSKHYKDSEKVDWEVKYIPRNQLAGNGGSTDTTPVAIVFPDPNWSPSLMVLARSRIKMSIGLSGNPDYDPYTRNYYGTNPITIATGSEEYEFTKYSILPSKNTRTNISDLYSSYVNVASVLNSMSSQLATTGTLYQDKDFTAIPDYGIQGQSIPNIVPGKVMAQLPTQVEKREEQYATLTGLRVAQDHSFKSHITTNTFVLAQGRPPTATIRKPVFEEVISNGNNNNPYPNTVTLITSGNYSPFSEITASVSVGGAENLSEALQGASFKLTMDALGASSSSVTLDFKPGTPQSMLNSRLRLPGTNSIWVSKGVTQNVQFSSDVAFVQPIEMECGILFETGIASSTVQLKDENSNGKDSVEVEVVAEVPKQYGTPITEIPPGFGRWLDTV